MSGISYKDLVNDLSQVLISFIEPMNLKFHFGEMEVSVSEVFAKCGLMPLFLYDKQSFINYSLRHKKIDQSDTEAFAKIHIQEEKNSFCNIKIDIVHNLFNADLYIPDNSIYESLLYSLAAKILGEKDFIVKGKHVYLDDKYDDYFKHITNEHIPRVPEFEKVKGDLT